MNIRYLFTLPCNDTNRCLMSSLFVLVRRARVRCKTFISSSYWTMRPCIHFNICHWTLPASSLDLRVIVWSAVIIGVSDPCRCSHTCNPILHPFYYTCRPFIFLHIPPWLHQTHSKKPNFSLGFQSASWDNFLGSVHSDGVMRLRRSHTQSSWISCCLFYLWSSCWWHMVSSLGHYGMAWKWRWDVPKVMPLSYFPS